MGAWWDGTLFWDTRHALFCHVLPVSSGVVFLRFTGMRIPIDGHIPFYSIHSHHDILADIPPDITPMISPNSVHSFPQMNHHSCSFPYLSFSLGPGMPQRIHPMRLYVGQGCQGLVTRIEDDGEVLCDIGAEEVARIPARLLGQGAAMRDLTWKTSWVIHLGYHIRNDYAGYDPTISNTPTAKTIYSIYE